MHAVKATGMSRGNCGHGYALKTALTPNLVT